MELGLRVSHCRAVAFELLCISCISLSCVFGLVCFYICIFDMYSILYFIVSVLYTSIYIYIYGVYYYKYMQLTTHALALVANECLLVRTVVVVGVCSPLVYGVWPAFIH